MWYVDIRLPGEHSGLLTDGHGLCVRRSLCLKDEFLSEWGNVSREIVMNSFERRE
jgi:hypothetical protein